MFTSADAVSVFEASNFYSYFSFSPKARPSCRQVMPPFLLVAVLAEAWRRKARSPVACCHCEPLSGSRLLVPELRREQTPETVPARQGSASWNNLAINSHCVSAMAAGWRRKRGMGGEEVGVNGTLN